MKTLLKVQKDGVNTLKEEILNHSNKGLKKTYIVISNVKESGYDIVEEFLIDLKAKKNIVMGIDKKNTTKKMLENILSYTRSVAVWDNNEEVELNANVFVFEYEDKAYAVVFNGDLTDSVLETDTTMYFVTEYDLIKDKKEYMDFIDTLTKSIKEDVIKLSKEVIEEFVQNKKIFSSKQYLHSVPSIAELLGNKDAENKENEDVEQPKVPKVSLKDLADTTSEIDLSDVEIPSIEEVEQEKEVVEEKEQIQDEIDFSEYKESNVDFSELGLDDQVEDMEENYVVSDEAIDMEALIFESSTIKLDKKTIEKNKNKKEKKEDEIKEKKASKKIDLEKVSNIIMELPKKPTKGREVDSVKVPVYIKDMIPNFFEIMEDAKLVERENGKYKQVTIKLEIIDVNTGNKFTDNEAKLSHRIGQTYVTFESDKLIELTYEELDIARIIKLSNDSYHIEIIPREIEEYNLWRKMCTNTFRGSSRQYGLM